MLGLNFRRVRRCEKLTLFPKPTVRPWKSPRWDRLGSVIIARMITDWHSLAVNAGVTLLAASLGFVIGTTVAILLSVSFLYSRSFERAVFPWAIVLKIFLLH